VKEICFSADLYKLYNLYNLLDDFRYTGLYLFRSSFLRAVNSSVITCVFHASSLTKAKAFSMSVSLAGRELCKISLLGLGVSKAIRQFKKYLTLYINLLLEFGLRSTKNIGKDFPVYLV